MKYKVGTVLRALMNDPKAKERGWYVNATITSINNDKYIINVTYENQPGIRDFVADYTEVIIDEWLEDDFQIVYNPAIEVKLDEGLFEL
jgi:hypothetical protein